MGGQRGGRLRIGDTGHQHRAGAVVQQLGHDLHDLTDALARPVDRLGQALAQSPVVVDAGVAQVGPRQAGQLRGGVGRRHAAGGHVVEQGAQGCRIHAR